MSAVLTADAGPAVSTALRSESTWLGAWRRFRSNRVGLSALITMVTRVAFRRSC